MYFFAGFVPADLTTQVLSHTNVFLIGAVVMAPAYVLRAYKTWLLLGAKRPQLALVSASLYASIALNNVLPFRLGDVLRLFYLRTILKIGLGRATGALLIERVVDLMTILSLFAVMIVVIAGAQAYEMVGALIIRASLDYVLLAIAATVASSVVVIFLWPVAMRMIGRVMTGMELAPRRIACLVVAAIVQWILEIIILSIVTSRVLPDVDGGQAVLSSFMANLSTLVPSAPGYVGTFEVAGILPFQLLGGKVAETAALFVVLYHLIIWVFSTGLGALAAIGLFVLQMSAADTSVRRN